MDVPSVWEFALVALAAWRVWHLLAEDEILDRPRDRWFPPESKRRTEFLECPYCSGAWIAGAWWLAWTWHHSGTTWFAALWAVMAVVVFIQILVNLATE